MALSLTVLELATELRASDGADDLVEPQLGNFTRLLAAVSQLVEDYAPDAPVAVQNEAGIRLGAWLYDNIGGRSQQNGMDASGARGLLAPYRIRRAFPVDGGDSPAGVSPGETATQSGIAAAIEAHRAMSDAHHVPGTTGVTVATNVEGRLPAAPVAFRMGWTLEADTPDADTFLRSDNHPDDGATEGTTAGLDTPPIPPTLATDEDYRLHLWIAGIVELAGLTDGYGDNWISQFSNEGALTVDGVAGILYSEFHSRHDVGGLTSFVGVIAGELIATQPWVEEQIGAAPESGDPPENAVDQDYVTNAIVAAVEAHRALPATHHTPPDVPTGLAAAVSTLMDAQEAHFGNESAHHVKTEIPAQTDVETAITEHDGASTSHTVEISRRVAQIVTIIDLLRVTEAEALAEAVEAEIAARDAAIATAIAALGGPGSQFIAEAKASGSAPTELAYSGLKIAITPSSALRKLLIQCAGGRFIEYGNAPFSGEMKVYRGGSDDSIVGATLVNDVIIRHKSQGTNQAYVTPFGITIDSPASADEQIYRVWWRRAGTFATGSWNLGGAYPLVLTIREVD